MNDALVDAKGYDKRRSITDMMMIMLSEWCPTDPRLRRVVRRRRRIGR